MTSKTLLRAKWFCLPLLLTLAGPASANAPGVTDKEIKIGEVLMLSGPAAFIGKSAYVGSKLAAEEINAAGGINGRKLTMVYEDDGYVPARSVAAMRKLIDVDNVFAVTGTTGGSGVTAVMPVLEEAGVPTIVHVAPNTSVLNPRRANVFMIGPDYDIAAFQGIEYLVKQQGKGNAKFGVLYQNDDYGKGVLRGYQQAMKEFNLTNAAEVPYQRGNKDFSAEALKLKSAGVEVLYLGTTVTEPAGILAEARRLGMETLVPIGNWAAGLPATTKMAAQYGYDYYFSDYYASLSGPAGKKLVESAKKHLSADELEALSRYSVSGYVGVKVMAEAIRRCGDTVTRDCVIQQLGKLKDFDTSGLTSPISFDNGAGHATPKIEMYQLNSKDLSARTLTGAGAQ